MAFAMKNLAMKDLSVSVVVNICPNIVKDSDRSFCPLKSSPLHHFIPSSKFKLRHSEPRIQFATMVFLQNLVFGCSSCHAGHRAAECTHVHRGLFVVNNK